VAADRQPTQPAWQGDPPDSPMARWLRVVEAFATRGEWGVRDLAAASGLPRSSVSRILQEMLRLGILVPGSAPGRCQVGPTLTRLAIRLADGVDVVRVARPVLDGLRAEVGETAILTLYDRARQRFRAVMASEAEHPIRYIWESLQAWSEVHLGASGRGILAFLPDEERERVIGALPDPVPGPRGISHATLREELERAREDGWVVSHGDRIAGAVGVSAPIRDAAGRVTGGVLLGWPDNRTDPGKEARAARAAARAAQEISAALGWTP
jgi:DNA-binding IclR family transcriptional regulator